jgi:hypothetical protein
MWVVGAKVVLLLVSLYVTFGFWVVFTGFLGLVRHGCGGLVGWQMVLLCSYVSSDWDSGGALSVALRLS